MTKDKHRMFRATVLAASLACAMGWSSIMWAQTTPLKAPTGPGATLKTTPLTAQSPLTATPAVQPNAVTSQSIMKPATNAVIKKNVLQKATVIAGAAALSMSQKVAAASALLAEEAKKAKENQDKQQEALLELLIKNLNVSTGATLSVASLKASWGGAELRLREVLNVGNGVAEFDPKMLNSGPSSVSHPAAYCSFTAPEDGFYMVDFLLKSLDESRTVTADLSAGGFVKGASSNATLTKGDNHVLISAKFSKNGPATAVISSDGYFIFKSCEISRIK